MYKNISIGNQTYKRGTPSSQRILSENCKRRYPYDNTVSSRHQQYTGTMALQPTINNIKLHHSVTILKYLINMHMDTGTLMSDTLNYTHPY